MGFALPNGAHVYLASGYGPAITFTGATNAEHAVITVSTADDIAVGDIVHVNCNWSGIDNVNLSVLLENYPAAMKAIPETYYRELMGQREKTDSGCLCILYA
ncbi:TPA: phage tail assembly chaperone [Enterobacter hormaechei]